MIIIPKACIPTGVFLVMFTRPDIMVFKLLAKLALSPTVLLFGRRLTSCDIKMSSMSYSPFDSIKSSIGQDKLSAQIIGG